MSTFTIILLIIILVLIASDVYFLWRILRKVGKKKKGLPDERYFELKYNINLLKAVSAILIFLLGFLGFTTYQDITSIVESDFEEKFENQDKRIKALDSIVKNYESLVKSLKSVEGKSIENLNDIKREFGLINKKVSQTQEALKTTPQIFIVKNVVISEDEQKIYFSKLRTIDNEKLPNFKEPPIVNMQCLGADVLVSEVTTEYIEFTNWVTGKNYDKANCDLWIVRLR